MFVNRETIDAKTEIEGHGECGIVSTFKEEKNQRNKNNVKFISTFKVKKNTEERKMKGTISKICRNEKEYFYDYEKLNVKDRGNKCRFVCVKNNLVSVNVVKIHHGPFQVLLDNINVKIL